MKILITGGAGFIGVNLIAFLSKVGGNEITVLDNFSLGKRNNLDEFDVTIFQGDILDDYAVNNAIKNVDIIVHLASDTRVIKSIENPDHNFEVNVIGTYKLLKKALEYKVKKFVFASTGGAIMGEVKPPIHENMVPKPLSPYGSGKLAGEAYCSAFSGSYGLKTVCLRFSNVYGPRSFHKGSVIAHFFKQIIKGKELIIYGDGTQTRDLVFSEDICNGIHKAITSDISGTFQLGSGKPTSVNELVELLRKTVGKDYHFKAIYEDYRKGEIKETWCNITKARKILGYQPQVGLVEGLKQTWQWFTAYHNQ
jgi:UDP-glucose 4-epimerase